MFDSAATASVADLARWFPVAGSRPRPQGRAWSTRAARLAFLGLTVAAVVGARGTARADDARIVMLVQRLDEAAERSAGVVASYLADQQVRIEILVADPLPQAYDQDRIAALLGKSDALAVFWIHDEVADTWLTLLTPRDRRVLVRVLPQGASAVDGAGLILAGLVPNLQAGAEIGVAEVAPTPAPPEASPAPPDLARPDAAEAALPQVWLGLGYAALGYADEAPITHALDLGLWIRLSDGWSVMARYDVASNIEREAGAVLLKLVRHPLSVGAAYQVDAGPLELGLRLALGLDLTTESVHLLQPDVNARRASSVRIQLVPGALLVAPLSRRARLVAELGARVPFNPAEHMVPEAGGAVISPWPVYPVFMAGLQLAIN